MKYFHCVIIVMDLHLTMCIICQLVDVKEKENAAYKTNSLPTDAPKSIQREL